MSNRYEGQEDTPQIKATVPSATLVFVANSKKVLKDVKLQGPHMRFGETGDVTREYLKSSTAVNPTSSLQTFRTPGEATREDGGDNNKNSRAVSLAFQTDKKELGSRC